MKQATELMRFFFAALIGIVVGCLANSRSSSDNRARAPVGLTNESWRSISLRADDVAKTKDLDARQARGEFILRNERPLMRQSQERHFEAIAAKALTNNAEEYTRVFAEFGLSSEISKQLQLHLSRIQRASVEAESAIRQVLDARLKYDLRMRAVLSESDYARYREYESLKPGLREAHNIQVFIRKSGAVPLNSDCELALAQLEAITQSLDDDSWHGPYASLPRPRVGWQQVIGLENSRADQAEESEKLMAQHISELGLTSEQKECVISYHGEKLQRRRAEAEVVKQLYANKAQTERPEAEFASANPPLEMFSGGK